MDDLLYKIPEVWDVDFPIVASKATRKENTVFVKHHWHKQIELLLLLKGEAVCKCNSQTYNIKEGDLIVVNSNEIHFFQSLDSEVTYYWLVIDPSILQSYSVGSCEVKYIMPIMQNLILFENKISNDAVINDYIMKVANECELKHYGYELSSKALIFSLLVLLLRNHTNKTLTAKEYDKRSKDLERLNKAMKYISDNYLDDISTSQLAQISNFSEYYFSNIFKKATEMTVKEYIYHLRINKAEMLLKSTDMNISEIALNTGFNDINYFSRVFKKFKQVSPAHYRKNIED